jgi:hypothetical protein
LQEAEDEQRQYFPVVSDLKSSQGDRASRIRR